jgi:hypothetical protein
MEKLIYVILGFGVVGNIAVYYALYKVRKRKRLAANPTHFPRASSH